MDIESQYNLLLQSGELLSFPGFCGIWKKDKNLFLKYCEANEKILTDNYLDIEDSDEFRDSDDF